MEGMNLAAANIMLAQASLDDILMMSPEQRMELFVPLLGEERVVRPTTGLYMSTRLKIRNTDPVQRNYYETDGGTRYRSAYIIRFATIVRQRSFPMTLRCCYFLKVHSYRVAGRCDN